MSNELVLAQKAEVTAIIESTGITAKDATNESLSKAIEEFLPEFRQLAEVKELLSKKVTGEDQADEMAFCASKAKEVTAIMGKTDRKKVAKKADILVAGRIYDAIANFFDAEYKAVKAHLLHESTFAQRAEADRNRKLGEQRAKFLAPHGEALPPFEELGAMPDTVFDAYAEQIQATAQGKILYANEQKAKAEAEAKRIEAEAEAVKAEQARIKLENATAKAKLAEQDALLAKAKAEVDALKAEAAKQAQAKQAEQDALLAKAKALASAGDGEQLLAFIEDLREVYKAVPKGLTTPEGKEIANHLREGLNVLANIIKSRYA